MQHYTTILLMQQKNNVVLDYKITAALDSKIITLQY
jgi:hypothetical protein